MHMTTSRSSSLDVSWFARVSAVGPEKYDIALLTDIIAALDAELHRGRLEGDRFELLGAAMRMFPFDHVSPQVIVTVLRTLSSASTRIPNWTLLVRTATASLHKRKLDPQKILVGLT